MVKMYRAVACLLTDNQDKENFEAPLTMSLNQENRNSMNGSQVAPTLEDLTDTFEAKLSQNREARSSQTMVEEPPARNLFKLILEGKVPFDETAFDFEIEHPDQAELDIQIALLNLRLKDDLPTGDKYDEPLFEEQAEREAREQAGRSKLVSGFGFHAYSNEDREGEGVTYVGEWLNYKRHGMGILRNHRD